MSIEIRRARWPDLGEIHRSYRAQPLGSRALYHPFPFGSARLAILLGGLWCTGHAGPRWVRIAPRSAAVLLLARDRADGSLAGYGTVRFRRDSHGRIVARTGLFVVPQRRRTGVGRALKEALLARARALGAVRAEAFLLAMNTASAELNRQLGFTLRPAGRDDPRESQGHLIAEGDIARVDAPTRGGAAPSPLAEPSAAPRASD